MYCKLIRHHLRFSLKAVYFFSGEYAKCHLCQSIAVTSSTQFYSIFGKTVPRPQ